MGNFPAKIENFIDIFLNKGGYSRIALGLQHTILIAVCGLIIGIVIGMIKIPLSGEGLNGTTFSLTTTGGCLIASLVFGHFGKAGKINLMPSKTTPR